MLRALLNKWPKLAVYDQDRLADQILLEQFLKDLKENTQKWVRRHLLQNYKEALRLAEVFALSESEYPRERSTKSYLSPIGRGEEKQRDPSRWVPEDVTCSLGGHISWDRGYEDNTRGKTASLPEDLRNQNKAYEEREAMDCSYEACEEPATWEQPVVTVLVGGKPLKATLDPGCAQTLMWADLLPQHLPRMVQPMKMTCMHGELQTYR